MLVTLDKMEIVLSEQAEIETIEPEVVSDLEVWELAILIRIDEVEQEISQSKVETVEEILNGNVNEVGLKLVYAVAGETEVEVVSALVKSAVEKSRWN